MFKHHLNERASNVVVAHWFMMSFSAGCINAGGFLATGKFVSHVTGFGTLCGVSLAAGEYDAAIGILSVPVFFLLGAFLAGMLIDRRLYQKKTPHFDWVMGLSAICLFIAAGGEEFLQMGAFGKVFHLKQSYVLLSALCLSCGLQNASMTSASGSSIRTTHLTGLTTDLGLGLARLLTLKPGHANFARENYVNWLRFGSILSFVLGSIAGALFFVKLGYRGFMVPAVISAYAVWHGRRDKIAPHRIDSPL